MPNRFGRIAYFYGDFNMLLVSKTILTSFNHRNYGLLFKEVNLPSSSGSGRGFCRISQFFIATNKLNSAHQAKVIDNIYKQAKN